MRNEVYGVRAIIIFFLMVILSGSLPVLANPFMGNGQSAVTGRTSDQGPLQVRTVAADQNLVAGQAALRDKLADFFYAWKKNGSPGVFRGIIFVAFLYGILHAFGPGHRKTVVFSLYLARQAPWWEPGIVGLLLSLLHGSAAIVLLLVLRGVSGAISGKADTVALYMDGGTYLLLIVVAFVLLIRAVLELLSGAGEHPKGKMSIGSLLITGIYPCPGAILILVLSLTLNITTIGIIAVLAMSIGMTLPITASGYLAWFGRTGRGLKKNEKKFARISAGVEVSGYLVLLSFSVYIALPFIVSLWRMI
jgi:ABC-type nickel/cobalt efflux system permease component RcnA